MGAYHEYAENLRERKPSLSYLCQFLSAPASAHYTCRVISLAFFEGSKKPLRTELDFDGLYATLMDDNAYGSRKRDPGLESGVEEETPPSRRHFQGRLLFIEDIDKRTMEFLGSNLNIDPLFFAGHLNLPWTGTQTQAPDQCILPSQAKRQMFTNIYHHRTVIFDKVTPPAKKLLRRMNIDRKVVVSPISKDEHIGIVQHSTSVLLWPRKTYWTGIILVDRHIDGKYLCNAKRGDPLKPINLASHMFLSGYEDFLDSPPMGQNDEKRIPYPNRAGLLEDLLFYWSVQSPESFDASSPSLHSLAYYPLSIVAAEWMKYVGIMYRAIKQFEYSNSNANVRDEIEKLNSDMRALQRWRRRSMASEHKIKAVIRMLDPGRPGTHCHSDSVSLKEDFEYILHTVEDFGRRLESMLPVVTSLVSIIDSRRSVDETANVSRLTIVALIFIPPAFVSSLFSMNEKLGPGGPLFWIYFVVAVPITVTVILVAKPPFNKLRSALGNIRWPIQQRQRISRDDDIHTKKTEV